MSGVLVAPTAREHVVSYSDRHGCDYDYGQRIADEEEMSVVYDVRATDTTIDLQYYK